MDTATLLECWQCASRTLLFEKSGVLSARVVPPCFEPAPHVYRMSYLCADCAEKPVPEAA